MEERGKIKFIDLAKGYGFIRHEPTDLDVLFRLEELAEKFYEGQDVIFEIQETDRGLRAVNLRKP